jgi:hypothetical protein
MEKPSTIAQSHTAIVSNFQSKQPEDLRLPAKQRPRHDFGRFRWRLSR